MSRWPAVSYLNRGLVFVLALAPPLAMAADEQACSSETMELLARELDVADAFSGNDDARFVSQACKIAPWNKNVLIAAAAFGKPYDDERGGGSKTVIVATIDQAHSSITSVNRSEVEEDAITEFGAGSLVIDTARYQLAPTVRAFGVRFRSEARSPSCANGWFWGQLTLYVPEKRQLRPVLRLFMDVLTTVTDDSCIGSPTGHNQLEHAALTIALEKTRSHGFADLRVTARIEPDGEVDPPPGTGKRSESIILRYDGTTYPFVTGNTWWLVN